MASLNSSKPDIGQTVSGISKMGHTIHLNLLKNPSSHLKNPFFKQRNPIPLHKLPNYGENHFSRHAV